MWAALVVDLHPESPDWTALAGIAAGLIGSGLGYIAGRGSDKARYRHEERMADIADLRAVIERTAAASDARMQQLAEGLQTVTALRELESKLEAAASDEEAEALRPDVERLRTAVERFTSAERSRQVAQEEKAAMATLLTRLESGDPIVSAHQEVILATEHVLAAARDGDVDGFDAARREWTKGFAAFVFEAQKRLGGRLGPDRAPGR